MAGPVTKARFLFLWSVPTIAILFTLAFAGLWSGSGKNSPSSGQPKISWTPAALNATVSAGASKNFAVTFVASENLSNVALRVVPELQPFVQISPSTFNSVIAGQPVSVDVTVAIPATTLPQTVNGTIQLRMADGNGKNVANPLPIILSIRWAKYSNEQAGIQVPYPDFGVASKVDVKSTWSGATRLDVSFQSAGNANFASAFDIFLFQNPAHLTLSNWFHQNIDPDGTLIASGAFTETNLGNSLNALALSGPLPDDFGPVMSIYSISQSGKTIIAIAQAQDNEFALYKVTQDQVAQMLREIVANFQAP